MLTDPDGAIELQDADRVDSSTSLRMLILGGSGWTFITLLAGWRGHVRRRRGRFDILIF